MTKINKEDSPVDLMELAHVIESVAVSLDNIKSELDNIRCDIQNSECNCKR